MRASTLTKNRLGTVETADQRSADQRAAQAAVDAAEALVRDARFDLDHCRITAPFSGRIGTHLISVGNLISGSRAATSPTTLLATLVSIDPIYLNFDMSEADYMRFLRERQSQTGPLADKVEISLADETAFTHQGTLDFVDNALDRSSGTIHARATVPNSDLLQTPGGFARVRLEVAPPAPALLVPDASVLPDQSEHVVLTVGPDNVVTPKQVQIGRSPRRPAGHPRGPDPLGPDDYRRHPSGACRARRYRRRPVRSASGPIRAGAEASHETLSFLHRPPAVRHGDQYLHYGVRFGRGVIPAGRPIPEHRPANRPDHGLLPRRFGRVVARTVATPLDKPSMASRTWTTSPANRQVMASLHHRDLQDRHQYQHRLMLTHNRVQDTLSRLPQEVQLQGVQVKKTIPALLLGVHPYSPDGSRSPEYISNYMILHVRDEIARLPGCRDFWIVGERQYAMRIWIDPDKAAANNISAGDILRPCAPRTPRSRPVPSTSPLSSTTRAGPTRSASKRWVDSPRPSNSAISS